MVNTKPYNQLNAVDLVDVFQRLTGGYIIKGRDAHLFREFMDKHGVGSSPIVLGLHTLWKVLPYVNKDVPSFLRYGEEWLVDDELEASAELIRLLTRERTPSCYYNYMDNRDCDNDPRRQRLHFAAREELRAWVDDQFSRINTGQRGSRSARRS